MKTVCILAPAIIQLYYITSMRSHDMYHNLKPKLKVKMLNIKEYIVWVKCNNLFICIFRLWRLYNNLEPNSPLRYHVYYHVIELAARVGFVREVFTGVEQLRKEFAGCPPSNEQMQKLYRLLHQVLKDQNR